MKILAIKKSLIAAHTPKPRATFHLSQSQTRAEDITPQTIPNYSRSRFTATSKRLATQRNHAVY